MSTDTLKTLQNLRRVLNNRWAQALTMMSEGGTVEHVYKSAGMMDAYRAAIDDVERQISEVLDFQEAGIKEVA